MVLEIHTDFPERFKPGKIVYLGENHTSMKISSQRTHNEGMLIGFEGIATPEQAARFRNQDLTILAADAKELQDGEYYFHELQDLEVLDEAGKSLGKITEILETGANDVYVVTGVSEEDILLPAIPEVILNVDLDARQMKVHLLPGLVTKASKDSGYSSGR